MHLADLVEAAKSKEVIIQGLTSDLAHSKKEFDELKSTTKIQYDALVEKVGKMRKELKQEVQEVTEKFKASEKQFNEEKSKSAELQNEVDELNKRLKLQQKTAQQPKAAKNEDEDDDEDDEVTQLKEQLDEMSDKNIELSRARKKDFDQIKVMNEEKNVLKAKIDELTRKLAAQTKSTESSGEADQLKVQLESITMKNLELTKKCSTDIEIIRLITEERNVITVRVEELHIRYVTLTKTVEDLEHQKAQLQQDANSNASNANTQLGFVKKQLEDFSNIALSLTNEEQKNNQLQEQRDKLNKNQEDLNQQHKSNEKSQQNNEKYQQDNEKLNNQINDLNTQINSTTIEQLKKLVDEKKSLEQQFKSLNEQSKGLRVIIQKAADQTETTQRQMDDFTTETLTLTSSSDLDDKQIKSIIEERDRLLKSLNELTLKYQEMDKNGPNAELESKKFMVQSELLKTQVDDLNQRILEQTLSNIKKIQAERNSLKKQLEGMAGDGADQNKFFADQIDELKKTNDQLSQECKTSKNQNAEYLKEIELLKQQIKELKERILELTSSLDKEQKSNKDLSKQVDELSNQIKDMLAKSENDEEESQQSKILRIQNDELNAKHQQNMKNIKKLNEDIDNLKMQLLSGNNGQQEIENLNNKVNQLNQQMATDYEYLMKILAEMTQLKQKLANGDNNQSKSNLQMNKSATPSHRKSTKSFISTKTLVMDESFASQFNQDAKKDQLNLKIWRY